MNEISGYFGSLGLPASMTLVLALFYHFLANDVSDKLKTLLVILVGIVLSGVWMVYSGKVLTFVSGVDCFFYGLQLGATSIGLFKVGQAVGVFSPPGK